MKVVISIPAYNEEKTLVKVISDIKNIMNKTKYNYEILVLNDGSIDKTADLAKKEGAIVVSNKRNLGLAETFKREMEECLKLNANIIVHTDADGQYPAQYIPLMIKKIEENYDLVLGSRFGAGNYKGSFLKRLGNVMFAKVFSSLLRIKLKDTTTGFRAFTSEVAKLPLINNFTYTQEQLIRVGKKGLAITEVPIKTRKTRKSRLFRNPIDYAIKAWINIIRVYRDYSPLKFFGGIGIFFSLIGFFIGLWLFSLFILNGTIGGHVPSAILSMLLILMGVQIIFFGFLADMRKS